MYCQLCHGENLGGLTETYGPPLGPNLTKVVPQWTEEQFITFFRTGQIPQGAVIGETMPWEILSEMLSDDDLKAMYAYIKSLPPVEGP
jgi:mono/diheme cytochrome c family protein